MKKIVVVGTGFSGAIIARKIAEELDQHVIIVERERILPETCMTRLMNMGYWYKNTDHMYW